MACRQLKDLLAPNSGIRFRWDEHRRDPLLDQGGECDLDVILAHDLYDMQSPPEHSQGMPGSKRCERASPLA
jgi:hypothetical protein